MGLQMGMRTVRSGTGRLIRLGLYRCHLLDERFIIYEAFRYRKITLIPHENHYITPVTPRRLLSTQVTPKWLPLM